MALGRILDLIFSVYFIVHIPTAIFIDSQAIFPSSLYPRAIVDLMHWYSKEFKDPMMREPPAWYKSFVVCELTMQLPFFFVAAYAFFKGGCKWIRIPALVYASHVITTVWAISYHVAFQDFSNSFYPGPSTTQERALLLSIYSPFFFIPLLLLLRMIFDKEYMYDSVKTKRN